MLTKDKLRGSLLRCLTLTGLPYPQVAGHLTNLAAPSAAFISSDVDFWMPRGRKDYKETTLVDQPRFLTPDQRKALLVWWLVKVRGANLPNWDIASTCTIAGRNGLLLFEAKAHDKELSEAGKSLPKSPNGKLNHERIGKAIEEANAGLNSVVKGWALCRDSHYQLSNRFAWAWKLASLGIPVVLVYLGFLKATEMVDQGEPFDGDQAWQDCLRNHAKDIVPDEAWGKKLDVNGTPLWILEKSMELCIN